MKTFDPHQMALDEMPSDFLWEVAVRSLYTFILVFLFLKMTGLYLLSGHVVDEPQ